jgi:CheY-like chemotaxis protein
MSELLLDTDLDQDQRECADNIHRSANSLLTVINDILDFSKVESGRLDIEEVQFNLSVVLRDVNKMLSYGALKKGLSYETIIQPEIEQDFRVMGDPGRVRQILTNLVTNSIKFTSHGSVKMKASITGESQETVDVEFEVQDTGIGIEEEVRKRLFTPFSQADSSTARRFGGTGLGLTICKNLVELMHGRIQLHSKLGQGTRAVFNIPFNKVGGSDTGSPLVDLSTIPDRLQSEISVSYSSADGDRSPPMTPGSNGQRVFSGRPSSASGIPDDLIAIPPEDRKKIHILVVEDNQINQQIALKTIKKLGFSVNAVWNGQEALDYLLKAPNPDKPSPALVLMDCQMPIMDGLRATQIIRTQQPFTSSQAIRNMPIVAMTASAIHGDKEKCHKAGMDDYLSKPVKGHVLEKMLLKWAIKGRPEPTRKLRRSETARPSKRPEQQHADGLGLVAEPCRTTPPVKDGKEKTKSLDSQSRQLEAKLDRIAFQSDTAFAKSSETESGRAKRRLELEEKASSLRDEKLLLAADDPKSPTTGGAIEDDKTGQRRPGASHVLSMENLDKLEQLQHAEDSRARDGAGYRIRPSMGNRTRSAGTEGLMRSPPRPKLDRARQHESETTVTPYQDNARDNDQ